VGESRTYSAVTAYRIDDANRRATEAWRFDHGQSIYSPVCSSAYEGGGGSLLLNYAFAEGGTQVRVIGLNPAHDVVFDFQYANSVACSTSWNAIVVPMENLVYQ